LIVSCRRFYAERRNALKADCGKLELINCLTPVSVTMMNCDETPSTNAKLFIQFGAHQDTPLDASFTPKFGRRDIHSRKNRVSVDYFSEYIAHRCLPVSEKI
jgi:hypothetical protein